MTDQERARLALRGLECLPGFDMDKSVAKLAELFVVVRAEEREACAKIGDAVDRAAESWGFRTNCGELIRARSEAK